jgi:hypothetical protein
LPRSPAFEPIRTEYIQCLQAARPELDAQLQDVEGLLGALVDGDDSPGPSPLDRARAAYLGHLRATRTTFDQQVAELAALSAYLFLPGLWAA